MKQSEKLALLFMTCCILTGCHASSSQTIPPSDSAAQTGNQSSQSGSPAFMSTLPVISINTVRQDADALDFVTKPVASLVSKQIASWTPGYQMPPEPYYENCKVSVYMPGESTPVTTADAQVKVRGNWTTNYNKKPLRIKFAEKQNLLGMNSGAEMKNWVLLAEYKDASMLRDAAMLGISRDLLSEDKLYASDAALAEVQINGQYWGVYLATEQQQVSKERVNISKPKAEYTGTDIGYFLEFDGYYYSEEPLQSFHISYADNAPLKPFDGEGGSGEMLTCLPENGSDPKTDVGFTIKSDIHSQEQHDFIASYVENVYRIMYAAAYEHKAYAFSEDYSQIHETDAMTPQQAVEAVVNIRSLAEAYIISEIACDADLYWSSFFMSADFGENGDRKLTFTAPWDFDSAVGNKARCADGTGFYAGGIIPDVNGNSFFTVNPWLAVLMYEDWYQDDIREIWTKAYDSGIFAKRISEITTAKDAYADAFTRNNERWGISTNDPAVTSELVRFSKKCKTQAEAADYITEWLGKRIAFLNNAWHQ